MWSWGLGWQGGFTEQLMLGQHINKKGTMEQKGNQVSSLA